MKRFRHIAKRFALLLILATSAVGSEGVYINDSGTLREITGIFVNDSGTLREIQSGWINDSGTLRQFYSAATVTVSGEVITDSDAPGPIEVRIMFNSDGTIDK